MKMINVIPFTFAPFAATILCLLILKMLIKIKTETIFFDW